MFYLIPISVLAYKYRLNIGYYLMRTYSYFEILYNRWYNKFYINPDYKLWIDGVLVKNPNDIKNMSEEEHLFEIEYKFKGRTYVLPGNNLNTMMNYLENIETNIDVGSTKIYKWISAVDLEGNCYLDNVKKYSGPLGDFYSHFPQLHLEGKHLSWLPKDKLEITDFRIDSYIIEKDSDGKIII